MFVLPNFLGFFVFLAIPVVLGFVISFTNYNGFAQMDFVGLSNYARLFQDKFFKTALKNNLIYSLAYVPASIIMALLLALAVNKIRRFDSFFKTVFYFPSITSIVAIGIVWSMLMGPTTGPINMFLKAIGIAEPPKWIASSSTALMSITLVMVWKNAGYYMIMFLGGLKSIPSQLYEAAKVDGANAWQMFWNVTWPMLSPTTFMITILCIISSFQVFDAINVMTEGGPGTATTVLVFRIYQEGFVGLRYGYASAIAYFLFAIIMVVTLVQFWGQRKWVVYE